MKPESSTKLTVAPGGGVRVETLFPGAVLKPTRARPHVAGRCPWCRSELVRAIKTRANGDRVYRCASCVDPETGDWTVFTVPG